MSNKREIKRPYSPAFVSAESLAYILDLSRSTIDDYVKRGLLPKPMKVGSCFRYRLAEVESFIVASNDELAHFNRNPLSGEEDAFSSGVKNVSPSNA